jgi:hypothetical protein
VAVVADNASNMQGIRNRDEQLELGSNAINDVVEIATENSGIAEPSYASNEDVIDNGDTAGLRKFLEDRPMLLLLRCAAHIIQLVVNHKDVRQHWEPVLKACVEEAASPTWPSKPRPFSEIKWAGKRDYLMDCKKILAVMPNTPQKMKLERNIAHALCILEPLHTMTLLLQADGATLFDALFACHQLFEDFSMSGAVVPEMVSVAEHVTAALTKYLNKMCTSTLYAIVCFFHPCFNRGSALATPFIWNTVGDALVQIDANVADEWQKFRRRPPPPPKQGDSVDKREFEEWFKRSATCTLFYVVQILGRRPRCWRWRRGLGSM